MLAGSVGKIISISDLNVKVLLNSNSDIKIGDIVWLDGDLMTCRDVAHRRLVEYGRELPYDIKDKAMQKLTKWFDQEEIAEIGNVFEEEK